MQSIEAKIKNILTEKGVDFEEFEHEAVYTAEQAAKARGLESEKEGVKSMIFKNGRNKFILVLGPGDKKIDTKIIAQMGNVGHMSLAGPREVEKIAGVSIGSVAPFGLATNLKTYLNKELLKNEFLYFNPGSHTKTIRIKSGDLMRVVENPVIFSQ